MFSIEDLELLKSKNINPDTLLKQRKFLEEDDFYVNLLKPATINDGILLFTKKELEKYIDTFEEKKDKYKILKFVPASGAASRMFQFLTTFLNEFDIEKESINAYINKKKDTLLQSFIIGIEKFPFYETVNNLLKNKNFESEDEYIFEFINILLAENHLNFSNKPKGVIPFHKIDNTYSTPIDKHLEEAMLYCFSKNNATIHFTISKDFEIDFEKITQAYLETNNLKSKIDYSFSYQEENTDTIAWTKKMSVFKDNENQIVTRPSGHGALIHNLNNLDADIVFIKNIDNVLHHTSNELIDYKKALAGKLIKVQDKIFYYLNELTSNSYFENFDEIKDFVFSLNQEIDEDFDYFTNENKINYLIKALHKPIRMCGMVKNEGEPGGGPFWVLNKKGVKSLQIIETSQIDIHSEKQNNILKKSTHFNPVDLVCSLKDHQNKKYNLLEFVDENMGFMVRKSKNGNPFIAYELPGLWNGSMANWHTIFVEVPVQTFNPVKTVVDLLKPAHQRKLLS